MLALWFDFWSWGAAPSPPPPPPAPAPDAASSNAGGGKRRREYVSPHPDFWDVRERYLRRFLHPLEESIEQPAPIETSDSTTTEPDDILTPATGRGERASPLAELRFEFDMAALRARQARDALELQQAVLRANALALDISKTKQQYFNRAIALLLLDVS